MTDPRTAFGSFPAVWLREGAQNSRKVASTFFQVRKMENVMHETRPRTGKQASYGNVAEGDSRALRSAEDRLSECANAERPMVSGRPLHGSRLENAFEPTTAKALQLDLEGQHQEVEGMRAGGSEQSEREGASRSNESVASLGAQQGERRDPLHSQAQTSGHASDRPRGPVSTSKVMQLLAWQGYACALTGRKLTPGTAALDHIKPLRLGGEHVIENAQVLHKHVNRAKGPLSNEEFLALCREVVRWSDLQAGKEQDREG